MYYANRVQLVSPESSTGLDFYTSFDRDAHPGYHSDALYTVVGEDCREDQVCNNYNHGNCKRQEDPHCTWILKITDTEKCLIHVCSFVLLCSGMLCGSKDHSALEHELLPPHCWIC